MSVFFFFNVVMRCDVMRCDVMCARFDFDGFSEQTKPNHSTHQK
jgi:hypothetical protein